MFVFLITKQGIKKRERRRKMQKKLHIELEFHSIIHQESSLTQYKFIQFSLKFKSYNFQWYKSL